MSSKRGLQLDRVVLLGRTFDEYSRFFAFHPRELAGKRVLDIASGVSSFRAEAARRGIDAVGVDPIYELPSAVIAARCQPDIEMVFRNIENLPTYRWTSYRDPEQMKELRERAYKTFLDDYEPNQGSRYISGALPRLPFENRSFDVTFVSYFLFVYQEQFNLEFHREAIREIMRVTRIEARVYPLVTFEAERSDYLDALVADATLAHLRFEEVRTDFEFLINSNAYLKITHV